jgi:hypothetical protein
VSRRAGRAAASCAPALSPAALPDRPAPIPPAPPQGLGATLLRNTPANAVYLGTFEVLKRAAAQQLGTTPTELPAWVVLSSAGLGGICYWLAIFPVDCIKSAMQTDSIIRAERKYTDIPTTAKVSARPAGGGGRAAPGRARRALDPGAGGAPAVGSSRARRRLASRGSTARGQLSWQPPARPRAPPTALAPRRRPPAPRSCCGRRAASSASTGASRPASSARPLPTRPCYSPWTASRQPSQPSRRARPAPARPRPRPRSPPERAPPAGQASGVAPRRAP